MSYELNVNLPLDARFAETARELAIHAARHAGCAEAQASEFGERVEAAIRSAIDRSAGGDVPLVFRRTTGPVEVLVNGHTLAVQP